MTTNRPAFQIGCLILAATVLTTSPLLAQTQEPTGATAAATVISNVAITQAPQHASVRVEGEGRLDVRAVPLQRLLHAGLRLPRRSRRRRQTDRRRAPRS